MERSKISPACDQFPLKQLTLALIKSRIDESSKSDFDDYLDAKKGPKGTYFLEDPSTGKRMELIRYGGGVPTIVFACFRSNNTYDDALVTHDQDTKGGVYMSGAKLLETSGGKNFADQSSIQVGFNPSQMTEEKVTGDAEIGSTRIGRNERGFFFVRPAGMDSFLKKKEMRTGKKFLIPFLMIAS